MKLKHIYIIAIILITVSCNNKGKKDDIEKYSDLVIPGNYTKLTEVLGDLDNDKVDEKILVYNTDVEGDLGLERIIYICKEINGQWKLWKTAKGPVLQSKSDGHFSDSFDGIVIENNKIYISHTGGMTLKWYYNHCYKLIDDEFRLTKVVVDKGIPCEYWETYIYDLVSAKINYEKVLDDCENTLINQNKPLAKKEIHLEKQELPLMYDFVPGENNITVDLDDLTVYY